MKNLSKKELTSIFIAVVFIPGGLIGSGIYLWKKYKNKAEPTKAVQKSDLSSRQVYNEMILEHLTKIVKENPFLRFSQIMRNYGLVREERPVKPEEANRLGMQWRNEFYLESEELLKRVQDSVEDQKNLYSHLKD